MSEATSKVVAVSAKVTFSGSSYDCKSLPSGVPESCDLPDVTTCSDSEQHFDEAAVTEDGDITATLCGAHPPINATGSLSIVLEKSIAGGEGSEVSVDCGNCIVTNIEPSTIEAGGERVQTFDVTFKPDGSRD